METDHLLNTHTQRHTDWCHSNARDNESSLLTLWKPEVCPIWGFELISSFDPSPPVEVQQGLSAQGGKRSIKIIISTKNSRECNRQAECMKESQQMLDIGKTIDKWACVWVLFQICFCESLLKFQVFRGRMFEWFLFLQVFHSVLDFSW